jgi:hypothetical protein
MLHYRHNRGETAPAGVVPVERLILVPCRVLLPHNARNLRRVRLSYAARPVTIPVVFLVRRAFALSPVIRLSWGAIFGPLVWLTTAYLAPAGRG